MTTGILRSKHINKLARAKNPWEYFLALQELSVYETMILTDNLRRCIYWTFDKYK